MMCNWRESNLGRCRQIATRKVWTEHKGSPDYFMLYCETHYWSVIRLRNWLGGSP